MIESEQAEHLAAILRMKRVLSHFTPERPMVVPPTFYFELENTPELAEMMDRVTASQPIPIDDTGAADAVTFGIGVTDGRGNRIAHEDFYENPSNEPR